MFIIVDACFSLTLPVTTVSLFQYSESWPEGDLRCFAELLLSRYRTSKPMMFLPYLYCHWCDTNWSIRTNILTNSVTYRIVQDCSFTRRPELNSTLYTRCIQMNRERSVTYPYTLYSHACESECKSVQSWTEHRPDGKDHYFIYILNYHDIPIVHICDIYMHRYIETSHARFFYFNTWVFNCGLRTEGVWIDIWLIPGVTKFVYFKMRW